MNRHAERCVHFEWAALVPVSKQITGWGRQVEVASISWQTFEHAKHVHGAR